MLSEWCLWEEEKEKDEKGYPHSFPEHSKTKRAIHCCYVRYVLLVSLYCTLFSPSDSSVVYRVHVRTMVSNE